MALTVTGYGVDITEEYVAGRVERLKSMFASEPDVSVSFESDGDGVVAEVVVPVRGYRTLKACSKGKDAPSALDKAVRKAEWKYKLFWTRGSFRFGDCC
jgi:ribosome-associated translation inhibitor RaiA